MNSRLGNGTSAATDRKRTNAIKLTAPVLEADERLAHAGAEEDELSAASDEGGYVRRESLTVIVPPRGESATFGTSLRGYTTFYLVNLGPSEAEVCLTWSPSGQRQSSSPQLAKMVTNRHMGCEYYADQFHGAKVTLINLSPEAKVKIRVAQSA